MQPFENIKVIDFTHVLAGPFATYQLAVLGADVLKVENPTEPDQVRIQGPDIPLTHRQMGTMFLSQAANKRSLTLNIKHETGREILRKLVSEADVFVENFRPGALSGLGLGYDDLSALNPRLVYCSISAFGQKGPRGWQTGYDNVFAASSGLMAMTGTPETAPMKVGAPVIDYGTGAMAAFAIASALYKRERDGLGQHIDLAMLDATLMLMSSHITAHSVTGLVPRPIGNDFPFATLGCYETADGALMLGAANLRQQKRLWIALGYPEMVKNNNDERLADRKRETELLTQLMKQRSAQEWEDYLEERHIPAGRVRTMEEALADPQLAKRGLLQTFPPDFGLDKAYQVPVAAFQYKHGGAAATTPPPEMGQHNSDVLSSLGYSTDEIEGLAKEGVI
ncbi:CaiB/BaiF CoA-transferase family protein [Agrobacterium sp. T29]|uniref:CaiB/BaiF CoA transferase family protein n=1 Tax=Agrobacterium sp. T29 TaxID=2580515 RepID=UPI00115F500B|nr:CaiB/BaiF CoA-transferase family protein [Agrobacterium sp. T29]